LFKILLNILFVLALIILETVSVIPQQRYELNRNTPAQLVHQSYELMLGEVGKTETGVNRGIADKYNKVLRLPLGSPYCQSGQYWAYWKAASQLGCKASEIPMPGSGLANATFDYIKRYGSKTQYKAQQHDFIIWKHPSNYTGHIERIISVGKAGWVKTVGFNTSSGNKGSQRDGGGVWIRNRNIKHPLGRSGIRGLAGVNLFKHVKKCERQAPSNIAR